jgi:oligopeptide transport system substrate-binding protein
MLIFVIKKTLFAFLICLLPACNKAPPQHQTLRMNLFTEPPSLDTRKAMDSTSANVLINLFEGLTRIGEDHKPQPATAERIEISADRRTYTFRLRECYWSNGDRLTAHDFVHAWQTTLDPLFPSPFAYKLYVIQNAEQIKSGELPLDKLAVKALDSYTLEVTLKYPTPYFLELLAFPTFFPVHKQTDQVNADWALEAGQFVCNGPFCLQKWEHERKIVAVKNPFYWDANSVKLNAVEMEMIDDTTTEFYMFEMNELDWAGSPLSNLPPEFIPALREQKLGGQAFVHFYPATAVYYYIFNTEKFPLNNKYIRQALACAINREDIVTHVTQAGQMPATGLVPPMPGWEEPSSYFEDGDIALAQSLFKKGLEELGLTEATFPILTLTYNTNREHLKIAQAIQQQWKEALGITVDLLHFDWKVYLSKISHQDFQIARMGWIGDFHDPVSFLEPFKSKNDPERGGNNETGWEDPEYKACLEAAEKEVNCEKRRGILRKAEEILISNMPVIPIYYIVQGYVKRNYVKGVYVSPLGTIDFKHAYIENEL